MPKPPGKQDAFEIEKGKSLASNTSGCDECRFAKPCSCAGKRIKHEKIHHLGEMRGEKSKKKKLKTSREASVGWWSLLDAVLFELGFLFLLRSAVLCLLCFLSVFCSVFISVS